MTWTPDRAAVIHLARRTDRTAMMLSMLDRLPFPVDIVDAIDGLDVVTPPNWMSSKESYANGMSHRQVLSSAEGSILVLEEDAEIPLDFTERLETVMVAAPDWEAIMLGGEHMRPPRYVAPSVVRATMPIRSIGYILRGPVIQESIDAIDQSLRHWDTRWALVLANRRTFAPDPFIVQPTGSPSGIPDSPPYG